MQAKMLVLQASEKNDGPEWTGRAGTEAGNAAGSGDFPEWNGGGCAYLHEFGSDGVHQRAAVVDEDELVSLDAGEALAGEVGGAGAGVRAEEIEGNAVLGAEAEGDAFEAGGLGIEGLGLGEGVADCLDL